MIRPAQIQFLGTGTAFNTDARGCQALLLRRPGRAEILVDAGPDVCRSMASQGIDGEAIDSVFVTHLHGDHVAGWPFLLLHWILRQGRRRPLTVFGPVGTRETLEGLVRLCYAELDSRREFEIRYEALPLHGSGGGSTADGLTFESRPVLHHPSSLGYRLDCDGAGVAVSGDTAWCEGLVRLADGADLTIVECTDVEPSGESHLSLSEIRARRDELATTRLVLVHLDDAVAGALAADAVPATIAAYDGLTLDV